MALTNWLILDVSSAVIPDVERYLDPPSERQAPGNYSKPESIAKWQQEDFNEDLQRAALDLDLARVTGVGTINADGSPYVVMCPAEDDERRMFDRIAKWVRWCDGVITFGGHRFDLPLLMRRARYLGVDFPTLNLDRYKSVHVDLYEVLTNRGQWSGHGLRWHVRRQGWTDCVKPLSGAEEAQVPQSGRWTELEASLRADVTATWRLAQFLGVIEPVKAEAVLSPLPG